MNGMSMMTHVWTAAEHAHAAIEERHELDELVRVLGNDNAQVAAETHRLPLLVEKIDARYGR